jgi:hypothetical protein
VREASLVAAGSFRNSAIVNRESCDLFVVCACPLGAVRSFEDQCALIVVGRIHVEQEPPVLIERQQLIRSDIADLEVFESVDDPKCADLDSSSQSVRHRSPVARAERMRAVGVARHNGFGVRAELREAGKKWRRQKRHIARYHHDLIRWRLDKRRIKTAQRASPRNPISDDKNPGGLSLRWIAADNKDMRGNRAKHRELPAQNRRGTDRQRAFIASAEAPSAAAGQNCC